MGYTSLVPYDWNTRRKYLDLPFPISEYKRRVKNARKMMEEIGCDALLIFGNKDEPGDLVYLSNYIPFGRAGLVLPLKGEPVIITDAILHGEPINSYSWMTWVKGYRPVHPNPEEYASEFSRVFRHSKAKTIGLVGKEILPMSIWEALSKKENKVNWKDVSLEYTKLKSVRSNLEVALCKEVGEMTARAMKAAVESIAPGKTENEIAGIANKVMIEEGAHDRAFATIVNSGPRGGLKHSYPTKRKIKRGDLIYLDMGAMKYGYISDMSRSVVVGGANSKQKMVLNVILDAYQTLTKMMRPGVKTSELISKAHELESKSGLLETFKGKIYLGLIVHHAIGTSFFEFPSLGFPDTALQKNMSFAFEPMAHILDFGTAVIEDTMLITDSGAKSLTPYELVHW